MNERVFYIWTIYDHPADFPHHFVGRAHRIEADKSTPTSQFVTGDTLEEVRAQLPPGLYNLRRLAGDDPKIVESWI